MTDKPTDYRGALDLIHEWVESEDDMLPDELEPEALAWLIRKLGQERDEALSRTEDLAVENHELHTRWTESADSLDRLRHAAQCNMADVERLRDDEAKEVLVNLCRMILESPNDD